MALSTSNIASVDYGSPNFAAKLSELFDENGYVVVNNVFEDYALNQMQSEMAKIVEQMDPDQHPKSVFSTVDEEKHTSDKYFLESVDKIRFFYEEGAFDKENGKLVVPKQRALNKVGHALHWLNPVFKQHSFSKQIQCIIKQIGYKQPKIVQSMYIFKQPCIGGAVTDHVDSTFLQVEPAEHLVGIWIALDDSTLANGCLWFIPGSHKAHNSLRQTLDFDSLCLRDLFLVSNDDVRSCLVGLNLLKNRMSCSKCGKEMRVVKRSDRQDGIQWSCISKKAYCSMKSIRDG